MNGTGPGPPSEGVARRGKEGMPMGRERLKPPITKAKLNLMTPQKENQNVLIALTILLTSKSRGVWLWVGLTYNSFTSFLSWEFWFKDQRQVEVGVYKAGSRTTGSQCPFGASWG